MSPPAPPRFTDEQRLQWLAEQVKAWRTYVETPHLPAPTGVQADDDKIFSAIPPSHLIWHGIVHAVDHLDMFMNALVENGKAFPLAPQTLARSGVLGAAHALWLIDHDEQAERQRRALRLIVEECRQESTAMREIIAIAGTQSADIQKIIASRDTWTARAVQAGATLGMTEQQVKQRPEDTAIIDLVAKRYVAAAPNQLDRELVATYRIIWRTHSGTAHGLRWPALLRTEILGQFARGGHSGRLTAGGLPALTMSASAIALLTQRAIELYEEGRQPQ